MSKGSKDGPSIRDEYDFTGAQRGKYAERFAEGANLVLIAPEVQDVFPDAESVNRVLRAVAEIVRSRSGPK
jgi:hypothetical protein